MTKKEFLSILLFWSLVLHIRNSYVFHGFAFSVDSTIQLKILLFLNTDDTYDDTQGVLCTRELFL